MCRTHRPQPHVHAIRLPPGKEVTLRIQRARAQGRSIRPFSAPLVQGRPPPRPAQGADRPRRCAVWSCPSPPHTPYGSRTVNACWRQRFRSRHSEQICRARRSRRSRADPHSFSGWKKTSLAIPRHEARRCQSHSQWVQVPTSPGASALLALRGSALRHGTGDQAEDDPAEGFQSVRLPQCARGLVRVPRAPRRRSGHSASQVPTRPRPRAIRADGGGPSRSPFEQGHRLFGVRRRIFMSSRDKQVPAKPASK